MGIMPPALAANPLRKEGALIEYEKKACKKKLLHIDGADATVFSVAANLAAGVGGG